MGVDYSGAIMIKEKASDTQRKVYICLFTCMASRAVHLEIACDMSAATFTNLFIRFAAQWGTPSTVTSDNGTNFVATTDFLKQLAEEPEVVEYFKVNHLVWKFIHPRSPWEGGFYERMIGVVKKCLKTCMFQRSLSYDDIVTLIKEVMARVNNRPLTYVSKSNDELTTLTPNHLLFGRKINLLPPLLSKENDPPYEGQTQLEEQYIERSKLVTKFARIWETEYLRELRSRHYPSTQKNLFKLKVGDIVLLETVYLPRESWPLAKITRLFPDEHGVVRAVEIQSRGHLQTCTVNKLVPLEISSCLIDETDVPHDITPRGL
ncbi:MAG: hypothetical protein AAGJ80_16395, partial [Cyanobacteria bacterium J06553_1]